MTSHPEQSPERGAQRMALVAALVMAQLVAAKATRDALFLSQFEARHLPPAMVSSALLALAVALAVGRLMARSSPQRIAPLLFLSNAVAFAVEMGLLERWPAPVAAATYLHTGALSAVLVSAFWSTINERFDPHSARRLVSRIVAGAAIGAVGGGLAGLGLSRVLSLRGMLLVLVLPNLLAMLSLRSGAPGPARASERTPERGGWRVILETPYLRHLTVLVGVLAAADSLIDYAFKANVRLHYDSPGALLAFFAAFQSVAGLATLGLQSALAARSLRVLGIAKTMALLPATVVLGAATALAVPTVAVLSALRGASQTVANSLFRSGYEVSYTPLSLSRKRSAKAVIDVAADKLGSAAGSVAAMAVASATFEAARAISMVLAAALSLLALALTRALQRGYVASLADSLRSGAVRLDAADVLDATTRQTLHDTMEIDRRAVLAEVARARAAELPPQGAEERDPLVRAVADLRSADPARVKAALARHGALPPELVGHVIPLLAQDELLGAAREALARAIPRAAGQLTDALLDRLTDERVRRRLPRVLQAAASPRVVAGLLAGLDDSSFEVRHRCATALLEIRTREPGARIEQTPVLAAARAALGGPEAALADPVEGTLAFEAGEGNALGRRLAHVFTLLALVFDPEPLYLAYRALGSGDSHLRGTGREFLEVTLPADLIAALSPFWGDGKAAEAGARPRQRVVEDLLASVESLGIDRAALRALRNTRR